MINVIVPIVEQPEKFSEFVEKHTNEKTKFIVGVLENLRDKFSASSKNIEIHTFSKKTKKEEIINSLHSSKMRKGKILVLRRVLTEQEFFDLTNSSADIVSLKKNRNKVSNFFRKLGQSIIKKVFAFSYFEDISAICYSENMFELMSVCENLSMATRINKYVGVEVEEIETSEKSVKKDYNKTKNILLFTLSTLFFLGSIIGAVLICVFTKIYPFIVLLLILWIVVAMMLQAVEIVNFARAIAVGELRYGRAEEILIKKEKRKNEKN